MTPPRLQRLAWRRTKPATPSSMRPTTRLAGCGAPSYPRPTSARRSGYVVMMIGLFMASQLLVGIGALLFSAVLLFQIVTLPVEFDATARAKKLVVAYGIISEREQVGMDRVLNAAALTYVAAVVSTLLTLLYFLMRAGLLGGRDDEDVFHDTVVITYPLLKRCM